MTESGPIKNGDFKMMKITFTMSMCLEDELIRTWNWQDWFWQLHVKSSVIISVHSDSPDNVRGYIFYYDER